MGDLVKMLIFRNLGILGIWVFGEKPRFLDFGNLVSNVKKCVFSISPKLGNVYFVLYIFIKSRGF